MRADFTANFLATIALSHDTDLKVLLEIVTGGGTKYYGDQAVTVGAQDYQPQVLQFGRIQNDKTTITLANIPKVAGLLKANQVISIFLWNADDTASDKGLVFRGVIAEGIGGNIYDVRFTAVTMADEFDKLVGTILSPDVYPEADPDVYGVMIPILLGTVRNVKCLPIEAGMLTTLRKDTEDDAETLYISEHSRGGLTFTTSGGPESTRTVIIGSEEIIYTSCEKDNTPRFLTVVRGANSTDAVSHSAGDAVIEKVAELVYKIADHDLKTDGVTKPRIRPFNSSDDRTVQIDDGDYSVDYPNGEITLTNIVGIRRQVQLALDQQPDHITTPQPAFDVDPGTHDHADNEQTIDLFMDEVLQANISTSSNVVRAVDGKFIGSASFDPSNNDWYIRTSKIGQVGLPGTFGTGKASWRIWRSTPSPFEVTLNWLIDGNVIYSDTVNIDENEATYDSGFIDISSYAPSLLNEADSYIEVTDNTIPSGLIYVVEMWITANYTPPSPNQNLGTDRTADIDYTQQTIAVVGDSVAGTLGGDLIVNVQGKPDDGSGTYTGTPNALIEKPSHCFHWLIVNHSNGAGAGDIDLAGSYADCVSNLPGSYAFSVYLKKQKKLNTILDELAPQAFCRHRWSLIGKSELIRLRNSGTAIRTVDSDEGFKSGYPGQQNRKDQIAFIKPGIKEIANHVQVFYHHNPNLGEPNNEDAYEGFVEDSDALSITDHKTRKRPWSMPAIGDNDAMATDVRDKILDYYKRGHQATSFPVGMEQLPLEDGDLINVKSDGLGILTELHDINKSPSYDLPSLKNKQLFTIWLNAINLNVQKLIPIPASCIAAAVDPTVDVGFRIIPNPVTCVAAAVDPVVIQASMTVIPNPVTCIATGVDPTVIQASMTVIPDPASCVAATIIGGVLAGHTITPNPATCVATGVDPVVLYGSTSVTPDPASCVAGGADPTVIETSIFDGSVYFDGEVFFGEAEPVVENLATYVEVDPNSHIAVTPGRSTATNMTRDEAAYAYKDFGAAYFGDFEIRATVKMTDNGGQGIGIVLGLSNSMGDRQAWGAGIEVHFYDDIAPPGGGNKSINLKEIGGSEDTYNISLGTDYYVTFERSGTALTLKIYSDAERTALLDTLSITVAATTYRYFYVTCSDDGSTAAKTFSGFAENIDIVSS